MKPEATSVTVHLTGGKEISFETGKLAKQAGGAAVVRLGENVVLATATANPDPREGIDFFPLTVDYREYTYAGGRFPGGFIKREGRMSEREVLTSRQIDRPVRPMFAEGFKCETQVIAFVLSADSNNDPDVLGINARVVRADALRHSVPGSDRRGARWIGGRAVHRESHVRRDARRPGQHHGRRHCGRHRDDRVGREGSERRDRAWMRSSSGTPRSRRSARRINELRDKVGKPKRKVEPPQFDEAYYNDLKKRSRRSSWRMRSTPRSIPRPKATRWSKTSRRSSGCRFPEDDEEAKLEKLNHYYETLRERIFREQVINQKRRPDARAFDEVRDIWIEAGVLPRTHGSAIFTRGETQALVTATLGTSDDMQRLEGFEGESKKRFMLHYNFPPFSVGEVGFMRGAGRREIGHGALAERAVSAVLPTEEKWPYAMRVVSDILESNGSSSMATVCGASVALMDAGVPLKAPVAGVAMGLVKEGDEYAILTDIAGAEDHYGDMDFKVAGTKRWHYRAADGY